MMLAPLKREGGSYRPFPGPPETVVPAWLSQYIAGLRSHGVVLMDRRHGMTEPPVIELWYDASPILSTTPTGIQVHKQKPELLESPNAMAQRHLIEACKRISK